MSAFASFLAARRGSLHCFSQIPFLSILSPTSVQESLPPGTILEKKAMNEPEANSTERIPLDDDEFNLEPVDVVFILAVILFFVLIVAVVCR